MATTSPAPPRPSPARGAMRRLWSPGWIANRPRPLRILIRAVAIVLLVLFAIWLILFVTKGRFLKGPFQSIATSVLKREVRVGGDFQLYFAPVSIKFLAEDMAIANPSWARDRQFFSARLVDTRIATVPLIFGKRRAKWVNLDGGRIALEWDRDRARNTWTFGDPNKPAEPFEMPLIQRGTISDTRLSYIDPVLLLNLDVGFETVKASDNRFDNDIRFRGGGTLRAKPFTLTGGLLSPNETLAGGRNRLTLHAEGFRTTLDVSGTLPAATQIEGADLALGVRGYDLANLFDFIGVAVPNSRAYRIGSALTYQDSEWRFTGMKGVIGTSDIAGRLTVAMPGDRIKLTGDLATRTLDIIDAGPFFGYDPERLDKLGTAGTIRQVGGTPRILPDAPLRIDAIKRFDADVRYRVARIRAESFPVSNVAVHVVLDRSLLQIVPATMNVAGGTLTANVSINARVPAVVTDYDIRLSPTNMGKLLAKFGTAESGTTGTVSARIVMKGTGDTVRESLATSNGRIAFVLPRGTFWTRNIQLAELDIGTFVQKLFQDKLKKPVQINCGLVAFTVRGGIAAADPILIDTDKNVMLGRGGFSFKTEALDLAVRADAKTISIFSAQSPIGVNGYFAAPGIDPISPELVGRAGAGLGLALAASPLALPLAFVDPGDAKAAQCGPVLAGARASAQRTSDGKPRDDVGRGTTAKSESGKEGKGEKGERRKKFLGIF